MAELVVSTRTMGGGVTQGLTGEPPLACPGCVTLEITLEYVAFVSVLGRGALLYAISADILGNPPGGPEGGWKPS